MAHFPEKAQGPEGGGAARPLVVPQSPRPQAPSPSPAPRAPPAGALLGEPGTRHKARARREQITLFNSSLSDVPARRRDCLLLLHLSRDSTGLQGQGQMNKTRAIYSTRSDATGELDGFFVALPFFSAAHRPQ
jgi:hypothetical protein